jgi:hypothetical protein
MFQSSGAAAEAPKTVQDRWALLGQQAVLAAAVLAQAVLERRELQDKVFLAAMETLVLAAAVVVEVVPLNQAQTHRHSLMEAMAETENPAPFLARRLFMRAAAVGGVEQAGLRGKEAKAAEATGKIMACRSPAHPTRVVAAVVVALMLVKAATAAPA